MSSGRRQAQKEAQVTGRISAVAVVLVVAAVAAVCSARAARSSAWYWTSGACKSELQSHGVAIDDGRTFNVQKAFCIGLHNHCWLSQGVRRYKVFIAVIRSYDGVVRSMQLTVTGHKTWSGTKLKVIEHSMTDVGFANGYGNAAWSVARQENAGGCFDIHP